MTHPFYTHRQYLIQELEKLITTPKVKILEFGVGDGSSLILNDYARTYKNFNVDAYETDNEWLTTMKDKYELDNYKFHNTKHWDDLLIPENFTDRYDLIFIDQAPWEARIQTLELVGPRSNVCILHDYDFFNKGKTSNIYSVGDDSFFYKYNDLFKMNNHYEYLPPTLVLIKNRK
jgi:hypothetical protein